MSEGNIYATPRPITNIDECYFYHTMDIPGYGHVDGEWDLREGIREYLGGIDFRGKRVLEIGTASGFLSFYMESQGADVVGYDLSEEHAWDVVPFSKYDYKQLVLTRKNDIRKLNNAFWLCHRAYNSSAKVVYGTAYSIPEEIGMVDISTFGCVLLHLRDPFLALENALRLTREKVVVTEILGKRNFLMRILSRIGRPYPYMVFLPDFTRCEPKETWWILTPEIIKKLIGALGFEKAEVTYHHQKYQGRKQLLFTVVGHRTRDIQSKL